MTSLRPAILSYVKEKYKSEIEYLWYRYPNYAVFRHDDNKKWYGIVMDVARNKLGLPGDGTVDVLNVKVDDFLLRDLLIRRDGFLAGYHISRGNWITVLLDGTVTLEEIKGLIDISFEATASKKKKKEIRPPKVWIVPQILSTTISNTLSTLKMRSAGNRATGSSPATPFLCMWLHRCRLSCINAQSRRRISLISFKTAL